MPDPKDDLVLEVALAGRSAFIITHHTGDFHGAAALGIQGGDTGRILEYSMSVKCTLNVNIPESLCRRVQALAQDDGVPLDQFIATALAEKLAVLDADTHIRERASRGSREKFERVLSKVPDAEPEEPDRLSPRNAA